MSKQRCLGQCNEKLNEMSLTELYCHRPTWTMMSSEESNQLSSSLSTFDLSKSFVQNGRNGPKRSAIFQNSPYCPKPSTIFQNSPNGPKPKDLQKSTFSETPCMSSEESNQLSSSLPTCPAPFFTHCLQQNIQHNIKRKFNKLFGQFQQDIRQILNKI